MSRPAFEDHIVFLPTLDLRATEEFYAERLGLVLVTRQPGCTIFRWTGCAYVGFCQKEQVPQPTESVCLTLTCSHLDDLYRWLQSQGVETDGPPRHNPRYSIWQFFARDPNGYTLEFQRFDHEDWNAQGSASSTAL